MMIFREVEFWSAFLGSAALFVLAYFGYKWYLNKKTESGFSPLTPALPGDFWIARFFCSEDDRMELWRGVRIAERSVEQDGCDTDSGTIRRWGARSISCGGV
jgi:hypothetical protein